MKIQKLKYFFFILFALALVLGLVLWLWPGARQAEPAPDAADLRYGAVRTVTAYLALLEKPDARRVYLADAAAEAYRDLFARAGFPCATNGATGRFDVVLCADASRRDWADLTARVAESGVLVWALDVRRTTVGAFQSALDAFPCAETHLWMPGEEDWVLVGRATPRKVKLSAMLELFENERAFDDLAEARCDAIPDFFASYAGDRASVAGAFAALKRDAPVRPELFLTRDIPDIPWIVAGDTEPDILADTAREVRSMQVVRRVVAEGNLLARDGKTDDAVEKWHAAYLRNPHDTMLLERLHRLAVNARVFQRVGNVPAAAKCYETMICVNPRDAAAVAEYGVCLRQLGRRDLADDVMNRAKELRNEN